jgi:acyl-[acyl carrier protein]--UDP-N-acetylglucosamine O-acyltransferase
VYGNARVYGNAWVSGNAEVSGDAEVYGNARVYGDAEVYGNARVYGNAWVSGNAEVSGDAEVYGNARVSGDAEVYGDADYCCFQRFGSSNRTTTFFKTKTKEIFVSCGCFLGNLTDFELRVKSTHGDNKHAREYLAILGVVRIKFGLDNAN